jgi:hypothetical protein
MNLFLNPERSEGTSQLRGKCPAFSRLWKGLSPCEAVFERVPERDLVLAEAPAEQHLLVAPERREVDKPFVQILDEQPELLESRGAANDLRRLSVDCRLQLIDLVRSHTAAVAGNLGRDPRVTNGRDRERAAVRDHLLDERAHSRQQLVRLRRCEVAIGHGYMFS